MSRQNDCPDPKVLFSHHEGRLPEKEAVAVVAHLRQCSCCLRIVNALNRIEKNSLMPPTSSRGPSGPAEGPQPSAECLSTEVLYRFVAEEIGGAEKQAILEHLSTCEACLAEMASLVRNSLAPPLASETEAIEALPKLSAQEQVSNILDAIGSQEQEVVRATASPFVLVRNAWSKIGEAIAGEGAPAVAWRSALALVTLILLVVLVGRPLYVDWRSATLTSRAQVMLTQSYPLTSRQDARPSGGFRYSELAPTRGTRGEQPQVQDPVLTTLQKALGLDPDNPEALHLLGTYYLVARNDVDKAKELFAQALSHDSTDAALHNDLGVIAMKEGDYEEALQRFSRAAQYDPASLEAHYNLAIVLERLGRASQARRAWEQYLKLDPDSVWGKVARFHLKRLR